MFYVSWNEIALMWKVLSVELIRHFSQRNCLRPDGARCENVVMITFPLERLKDLCDSDCDARE